MTNEYIDSVWLWRQMYAEDRKTPNAAQMHRMWVRRKKKKRRVRGV